MKLQAVARAAPDGTCPLNLPPIISPSSSTLSDVLRPTCLNRSDRCRSVSSEDFRRPSPGLCVFSSAMLLCSSHTGRCQRVREHGRAAGAKNGFCGSLPYLWSKSQKASRAKQWDGRRPYASRRVSILKSKLKRTLRRQVGDTTR